MLTDSLKTSTLWKNYKGWGSTHEKRELFEELYRSYNNLNSNQVLTYGDLLPKTKSDNFYSNVKSLTLENNTWIYEESVYKKIPLVKLQKVKLTPLSDHCKDSFVVLDESGNQIKNIIPFDYSEEGLYNYKLQSYLEEEISFGAYDWVLDTNSSILTFNNGIPSDVSVINPPTLTFYQYIGPVGERVYIDASLYDVSDIVFETNNPVKEFTNNLIERLKDFGDNWYNTYKFNGSDTSQGIGLIYNILTPVTETESGDIVKGWDDNSNSQVVSLLSHKSTDFISDDINILFISEHLENKEYTINCDKEGINLIHIGDGFVVVDVTTVGSYSFEVKEVEKIFGVLLVKDNKSKDYDLYTPRTNENFTIKVPVFIDLKILPPHLKLNSLLSYSDDIVPQYYGPRVADYVIATDQTVNNRSADFIVYNKDNFYLQQAFDVAKNQVKANHIYLRNGEYKFSAFETGFTVLNNLHVDGESRKYTKILNSITLAVSNVILSNLDLSDVTVSITGKNVIIQNCILKNLKNRKNTSVTIIDSIINGELVGSGENSELDIYNTFVDTMDLSNGLVYITGTHVKTLNCTNVDKGSIFNTSTVEAVNNISENLILDSTYITTFSESIDKSLYPNTATIPYYSSFEKRVFAKLPNPFEYNEETNEITLKLDSVYKTIRLNENGELTTRFFTSSEISIDSDLKTQIEDVYNEHADTLLDHDKPVNLDEALIDLYWSKADLKNGKVPINQLPDSVAYGGLSLVGLWSFEDSNGEFPTFEDVDTSYMSDDSYTGLQNGWFFIVNSSHKEDDPAYPQTSVDGRTWAAGDWIICTGKVKTDKLESYTLNYCEPVDSAKDTFLQYKETDDYVTIWSSGQQYAVNKKIGLTSIVFYTDRADVYKSTENGFDFVESLPVEYIKGDFTGKYSTYKTVTQIKIGDYTFNVNGTAVRKDNSAYNNLTTQYFTSEDEENNNLAHHPRLLLKAADEKSQNWSEEIFSSTKNGFCLRPTMLKKTLLTHNDNQLDNIDEVQDVRVICGYKVFIYDTKWQKLDRSYLDPVYSRLPEYAPNTNGENPAWSILDGGTGLLQLSYKSLAEAIRLINEELFNRYPSSPASIQKIKVVLDKDNTTAELKKVIQLNSDGQLDQYLENSTIDIYNSESGVVGFKQEGIHDNLPLEHEFYCNDSIINVNDNSTSIYKRYVGTHSGKTELAPGVIINADIPDGVEVNNSDSFNINLDIEDPYEKYNIGTKPSTTYKGAEITGTYAVGNLNNIYTKKHSISYSLEDVLDNPYISDISVKKGSSKSFDFIESKFYDLSDVVFNKCEVTDVNTAALIASMNTVAGVPTLMKPFTIVGTFTIENFTKYKLLDPDTKVELRAEFGTSQPEVSILSKLLQAKNDSEGTYDLKIQFTVKLEPIDYGQIDLKVYSKIFEFNKETEENCILTIKDITCIPNEPDIKNNPSGIIYPVFNTDFTDEYVVSNIDESAELSVTERGFSWNKNPYVVNYTDYKNPVYQYITINNSTNTGDYYKYVTFKYSLDEIKDIVGLILDMDWGKEPTINKYTGEFEDILLEVLVRSNELDNTNFQNANKCVATFLESKFTPNEGILYSGKSTVNTRRITFGRKAIPVKDIYVRVGIPNSSNVGIKQIKLQDIIDC